VKAIAIRFFKPIDVGINPLDYVMAQKWDGANLLL
jgi:hypothetical protein